MSVQSRLLVISGRNTRFVQSTVDLLKKWRLASGHSFQKRSFGPANFSVRARAGVRLPFKLLIQSRTQVSGRNIGKRLVRILYMIQIILALWWQTIQSKSLIKKSVQFKIHEIPYFMWILNTYAQKPPGPLGINYIIVYHIIYHYYSSAPSAIAH